MARPIALGRPDPRGVSCPICNGPVTSDESSGLFATFCSGCGVLLVLAINPADGAVQIRPAGKLAGSNKALACKLFLKIPLTGTEVVELVVALQ